jgi:uncharacterized protein YggU (UPF0235/DUF167 family)
MSTDHRVRVKVNASSRTEGVRELEPDFYQVRTRAPAERGRANVRVLELLAEALNRSPADLRIVSGATKPLKIVAISAGPES